jgi:hypothetical protein
MTICIYGDVEDKRAAGADLPSRLGQLALCCRGLELAVDDFCADKDDDVARRLARMAASVAEQSERLARAVAEGAP